MPMQKCTYKCPYKSVRLNGKTKVYLQMARKNCSFKWKDYSVPLDGKIKVYV